MLRTENEIEKYIFNLINNTEKIYKINNTNENINLIEENTFEKKENKLEKLSLNNLQYRFGQIEKKNNEKIYLRLLNNKKKVINTVCDNYNDIISLDNHNLPWNKLDKWQKKQKIRELIESKYNNNSLLLDFLMDMFKKGKINKLSKNIIYTDGKLVDITYPEFTDFYCTIKNNC